MDESTPPFDETEPYKKLQALAKSAYDFFNEDALTPGRIEKYLAAGAGFQLMYATQRVNDEVIKELFNCAQGRRVLEKMQRMQKGAVINIIHGFESEHRPALHTALRDHFDHPQDAPAAEEARLLAHTQIEKLALLLAKVNDESFTDLIVIGIGGSELGPKACYEALGYYRQKGRVVHFIGNIDPDCCAKTLQQIDPHHTLVAVVSKSGTTMETVANEAYLRAHWEKAGLKPPHFFLAVTGAGSPMDDPTRYRAVLEIWDWVGGRYSATSMVGGLPLAFALGFEAFWELLKGAHAMDRVALREDLLQNLPLLAALLGVWNRNFLNSDTLAIIPYADGLKEFCAHLQQLDMESNGKSIDQQGRMVTFPTGPIVWGQPGTNAQHSFFQLLHQGTVKVPIEFIGFAQPQYQQDIAVEGTTSQEKLLANLFAQAIALATGHNSDNPNKFFPGNTPSSILFAERLTPFQMGALLAFYEHKVAFQGFLWGINSFDQEGVQLGKRLTSQLLNNMAYGDPPYPLGEAFLRVTKHKDRS